MKKSTISDVASRAGVSKSTVSAVLNDKSVVKDSTRRAVLRAIDELGYRPSPSARRGFRESSGRTIVVVTKEAKNPFYAEVVEGIRDAAEAKGYLTFVTSSGGSYRSERRIVEECVEREVAGMIIAPLLSDDSDLSHLFEAKRHNVPFVLLEAVRGVQANLVEVDNTGLAAQAVSYLIEQGHSRIGHFAGPRYSQHSQERIAGARRAFSESHLAFNADLVVHTGHSLEDGYRTALEFFGTRRDDHPTAVTCYNDLIAIGVLRALRQLGIRVPEDVSVIGFDDLQILDYLDPPLTTVHVPKHEMGSRAAELLFRQIESRGDLPPERISLCAKLLVRGSTMPLSPELRRTHPAQGAAPGILVASAVQP